MRSFRALCACGSALLLATLGLDCRSSDPSAQAGVLAGAGGTASTIGGSRSAGAGNADAGNAGANTAGADSTGRAGGADSAGRAGADSTGRAGGPDNGGRNAGGAASSGSTAGNGSVGVSAFPVRKSKDQRTLVDANGAPFPILGRTAWFVISRSVADYQLFLTDTVKRGYNALEMHVLDHDPRGNRPPFAGNGELPFGKRLDGATWSGSLGYGNIANEAPDFGTPNEAYWAYVDQFLSDCEARGLLVFFFPAYVGYAGGDQGFMKEMVANGASKMQSYGAFLATRYKNQRNLVWMLGGDMGTGSNPFNTEQESAELGLVSGLTSVPEQQSIYFSAEWNSESIGTDQSRFHSFITLNSVYSWSGDVASLGRRAYDSMPVEPAFLLEEPYDQEGSDGNSYNPSATQPVRRFQWWGWLSTIAGYMSGNGYVWPFVGTNWQTHLDTQGSRDMAILNGFIRSVRWSELVPSGLNGVKALNANPGTPSSPTYVASAANPNGSLLVAYVPPAHSGAISVDLSVLGGAGTARWFDPTSGASTVIGSVPNTGTQMLTPPSKNAAGDADWVLVVEH